MATDREGRITAAEARLAYLHIPSATHSIPEFAEPLRVLDHFTSQTRGQKKREGKLLHEGWALVEDGDATYDGQPDVTCFRSKPDPAEPHTGLRRRS
jgi:hypothetical protein